MNKIIMKEYSKRSTDFSWKNAAVELLKKGVDKILKEYYITNAAQGGLDYISTMASAIAEDIDRDILNEFLDGALSSKGLND